MIIPEGWKKGSRLCIDKQLVHNKGAYLLSEIPISILELDKNSINTKHIAYIWFYSYKELEDFLKFWFNN